MFIIKNKKKIIIKKQKTKIITTKSLRARKRVSWSSKKKKNYIKDEIN